MSGRSFVSVWASQLDAGLLPPPRAYKPNQVTGGRVDSSPPLPSLLSQCGGRGSFGPTNTAVPRSNQHTRRNARIESPSVGRALDLPTLASRKQGTSTDMLSSFRRTRSSCLSQFVHNSPRSRRSAGCCLRLTRSANVIRSSRRGTWLCSMRRPSRAQEFLHGPSLRLGRVLRHPGPQLIISRSDVAAREQHRTRPCIPAVPKASEANAR